MSCNRAAIIQAQHSSDFVITEFAEEAQRDNFLPSRGEVGDPLAKAFETVPVVDKRWGVGASLWMSGSSSSEMFKAICC